MSKIEKLEAEIKQIQKKMLITYDAKEKKKLSDNYDRLMFILGFEMKGCVKNER